MIGTGNGRGAVPAWRGLAPAALFLVSYVAARALLEAPGMARELKVAAALLPVAPFGWVLWWVIRTVRGMDELEQRLHLEALALAFPLGMILLMTLGLLELAVALPPEDLGYRHVWAFFPAFYYGGLWLARRRYR